MLVVTGPECVLENKFKNEDDILGATTYVAKMLKISKVTKNMQMYKASD